MRGRALLLTSISLFAVAPVAAFGQASGEGGSDPEEPKQSSRATGEGTGAATYGVDPDAPPRKLVPGTRAKRMSNGYAAAPKEAPRRVQKAIWAANEIVGKPYRYGGGHASFKDSGYDCSGTVSYALHGGRFVSTPMASGAYMSWGKPGEGRWITTYANAGHMWVKIAGLRLDTSSAGEPVSSGEGPRWRKNLRSGAGYAIRHPAGF